MDISEYCIVMNPDYLKDDELVHELLVRGKDTAKENREGRLRILRLILKEEGSSKMIGADLSNLSFDADVEMDECEGKLQDINEALASTKYKEKFKLESRLIHLKFRLKRVVKFVVQDDTNYKKFSELLNRTVNLLSVSFPVKQKKSKDKQDKPLSSGSTSRKTDDEDEEEEAVNKEMEKLVMLMKSKLEDSLVEKVLQGLKKNTSKTERKEEEESSESSADSTETEESSQSDSETEGKNNGRHKKKGRNFWKKSAGLPVNKWRLDFSGEENKGLPLNDFLRQVEFLAESEGVTDDELLSKVHHLFSGKAKNWLLTSKRKYKSWKAFVKDLKRVFLHPEYDYLCIKRCESTLQDPEETFAIYLAEMERLFQSLSYKMNGKEKLAILKRNMKASYKHTLALADIDTLKKLELYCSRLDAVDVNIGRTAMGLGHSRQKQTYQKGPNIFEIERKETSGSQSTSLAMEGNLTGKNGNNLEGFTVKPDLEFHFNNPHYGTTDFQVDRLKTELPNFAQQSTFPDKTLNVQDNFQLQSNSFQNPKFNQNSFSNFNSNVNSNFNPNFNSYSNSNGNFNAKANINSNFNPTFNSNYNSNGNSNLNTNFNTNYDPNFNNMNQRQPFHVGSQPNFDMRTPQMFARNNQFRNNFNSTNQNPQQNSNFKNFSRFRRQNNFSNNFSNNSSYDGSRFHNNNRTGSSNQTGQYSNGNQGPSTNGDGNFGNPGSHNYERLQGNQGSVKSCWNCGGNGHNFKICRAKRELFCYACGKKGVTMYQCSKCNQGNA
jgi:hypothetical protein